MREKAARLNVCALSADTFRKVYLLTLIGAFEQGVYGSKRLQKIAYISERASGAVRPFGFIRHHFGQYSDELDEIKDQLISLGYVDASPLDTSKKPGADLRHEYMETPMNGLDQPVTATLEKHHGGNRYTLTNKTRLDSWTEVVTRAYPRLYESLLRAIEEYGYRKEDDLIKCCYDFGEFKNKRNGETIIESDLPDLVQIPGLNEDECEDLEMAFSPAFIKAMGNIVDGLERATIDWKKVRKVAVQV